MSTSGPLIECAGVRRRLGGRAVLAGVDLAVAPGETVALVGANGAGKSTLLKAIVDLRGIDGGSIRLAGRDHADRRARAGLAYLPERFQPPHYLRGRGFVDYMLALYAASPGDDASTDVCARLGLDAEALARPVQAYSRGMAQMLGLAACLLSGRDLLVLDEPLSGLDPTARLRVRALLEERRRAGATTLLSTHLMVDAHALADRIAILHGGRIAAEGAPADLARRFDARDLDEAFARAVVDDPA